MSPDLKRLCEAAARQSYTLPINHDSTASSDPGDYEPIVRAVLMELREPSESLERACAGIVVDDGISNVDIDHKADEMRAAMINAILAEPAKA